MDILTNTAFIYDSIKFLASRHNFDLTVILWLSHNFYLDFFLIFLMVRFSSFYIFLPVKNKHLKIVVKTMQKNYEIVQTEHIS